MSRSCRRLLVVLGLLSVLPACTGEVGGLSLGTYQPPIINGAVDTADGAVVALVYDGEEFCSGTLVSPRTVFTAGHCLEESGLAPSEITVFFGTTVGSSGTSIGCTGGAAHPSFYVRSDGAPIYDVAYLTLAADAPVAPLAWRSTALPSLLDQSMQMVGYGVTNAKKQTGNGTRRTVNEIITDQDSAFLYYGDGKGGTCQGDSGGPTFWMDGGTKTLVAVTSYGDLGCVHEGANTRVDAYASFLATHVTGGGGPVSPPAATPLTSGTAVTGLSGSAGTWKDYSIAVPAGSTSLVVAMTGGTGNADLYVRAGALPTTAAYDKRPYLAGDNETATVTTPAAGTYYVGIRARAAYAGVGVTATISSPSGGFATATEVEPNNSRPAANIVDAPTRIGGTVATAADVDYFRVLLPGGATLAADLTVPADKDFDLKLYNGSGALLGASEADVGLPESLTWTNSASAARVVYARIYRGSGSASATKKYQLQLGW